jgi:hypothetical protein
VLVVAIMPPVMQVLGAGARGCRREFRTPIHPGAAARRAGSGAWPFLVVIWWLSFVVGVSFQGLS